MKLKKEIQAIKELNEQGRGLKNFFPSPPMLRQNVQVVRMAWHYRFYSDIL
jgi:hypothetical protein